MKLLKKLLPIVTVASTVAIVAPIATSCGVKTFRYVFDEENPGEEFKPDEKIAAESETRVTASKATQAYLRNVKKNKKILADDITYQQIFNYLKRHDTDEYEIEHGESKVQIGNIDPETGKISKFSISMDLLWLDTSSIFAKEHLTKIDFEIKNMDFVVYPRFDWEIEEYRGWIVSPLVGYISTLTQELSREDYLGVLKALFNYLKYDKTWSLKATLMSKKIGPTEPESIKWAYDASTIEMHINEELKDTGNFEDFVNIVGSSNFNFRSYYFDDVSLA